MFNKIKDKLQNFKIGFIYLLIKISVKKENRKLFLKWIEMKEGLIDEYDFNVWVTKNILDEEQESEN